MLNIETQMLEDRQVKLVVTVEPERVQREMDAAARRIAKHLNIPGFRKGKAPNHIVRRYVGEQALLEEALEPLGQAVYKEALEQANLEPYAAGSLTDISLEPVVMTFTIPLQPEVQLGDFREVRVPYESPQVSEEDVDAALRNLREEQATLEPVERPVAMGDVAVLDIVGTVANPDATPEQRPLIERNNVRVLITEDSTYPVPGFPAQIVGMQANESREFDIQMSDDGDYDEEVRGKTIHFTVNCKEVYSRDVPELDDDFATSLGDYETLADLRQKLRSQLEEVAAERVRDAYLDKVFEQLEPKATIQYPPIMIDERIDELVEDFDRRLRAQNLNVEEYLKLSNLTMEQLREDFREGAQRSLVRALILSQVIKEENLSVGDEEIEDEIKTMMLSFGSQASMAAKFLQSEDTRRAIANRLLAERATNRLVGLARGEAGASAAEAVEAKPKKRAKKATEEAEPNAPKAAKPRAKKATASKNDAPSTETQSEPVSEGARDNDES